MSKLSITNILGLTTAVALAGTATGKILEDGTVDFKDVRHADDVFDAVRELGKVKFTEALPELKDLDEAEAKQLAAKFEATFDLPNDSVEATVEAGFALLTKAVEAIMSLRDVGALVKKAAA